MLTETTVLALRLLGPMQSWGHDSQFNRRNTALFPSKSALAGLCCAAMGHSRGSTEESDALTKFATVKLFCIAIPRKLKGRLVMVKRMQDYHTVMGTRDAKGSIKKDAVLTYRQYLNDAAFIALIEGETAFLNILGEHLQNPKWGVWLGRKACIPAAPVFAGIFRTKEEATKRLPEFCGKPLDCFTYVQEVDEFGSGMDSYMDQPVSFDMHKRQFAPRRVMIHEAAVAE